MSPAPAKKQAPTRNTVSKDKTGHEARHSLVVAVVDDDAAVRIALEDLFEASGVDCRTFGAAEGLLDAVRDTRFSCLVLDLDLPGRTGLELQRELAACGQALPIVFLSAHDQPHWRRLAMEAGARDYLVKPVEGERILAAVRRCFHEPG